MDTEILSLASSDGLRCPIAAHARMRAESPAYLDPLTGYYVITHYDDIREIVTKPELFSNKSGLLSSRIAAESAEVARMFREEGWELIDPLAGNDPPDHRKYRSIIDRAFMPARVRYMHDYIKRIANELIDVFPASGAIEFVHHYAVPLPVTVIADQLGVSHERFPDFKRWSDATIAAANVVNTEAQRILIARDLLSLQHFLMEQFEIARKAPRDDMISDIATAHVDDGRLLTPPEMISMARTLLVAGNESTANAIGSAVLQMIENGLEDDLRAHPERINGFVEEVLRLDSPILTLFRRTTQATQVGGVAIPENATIQIAWNAGNRDPRQFSSPDEFRMDRGHAGTRHFTFGAGVHHCVGNQLARTEMRLTIDVILQRLKNIRLAERPDAIQRNPHVFAYGPAALHITYETRQDVTQ